jgi:hypothetical protein
MQTRAADRSDGVLGESEHQRSSRLVVEDACETRQTIERSNGDDG